MIGKIFHNTQIVSPQQENVSGVGRLPVAENNFASDTVDTQDKKSSIVIGSNSTKALPNVGELFFEENNADLKKLLDYTLKQHPFIHFEISKIIKNPSRWKHSPWTLADERKMLAKLLRLLPLPMEASQRPKSVTFIDVATEGVLCPLPDVVNSVHNAYSLGDDITIGPEWLCVPNGRVSHTVEERDLLIEQFSRMTRGSDRLLIPGTIPWHDSQGCYYNTCYVFAEGKILFQQHKIYDGGDENIAKKNDLEIRKPIIPSWLPAHHSPPYFTWRQMRVGVEICIDHAAAIQRFALLGHPRQTLDVQIIVSAGVTCKNPIVGCGGVVILSQGDKPFESELIVRNSEGTFTDVMDSATISRSEDGQQRRVIIPQS